MDRDFADFLTALNKEGACSSAAGRMAALGLVPYRTIRDLEVLIEPTGKNARRVRNGVRNRGRLRHEFLP